MRLPHALTALPPSRPFSPRARRRRIASLQGVARDTVRGRLKTAKTVKTAGRRRSSAGESYLVLAAAGAPPHGRM